MQGADEAVAPAAAVAQIKPASTVVVKVIVSGTPHLAFASTLPGGLVFKKKTLVHVRSEMSNGVEVESRGRINGGATVIQR